MQPEAQDTKPELQAQAAAIQSAPEQETPEQINWRNFRQAKEAQRKRDEDAARERDQLKAQAQRSAEEKLALQQALDAALSARGNTNGISQQQKEDIIQGLDPNDIPTGAQVSQYVQKAIQEGLAKALQEQKQMTWQEQEKKRMDNIDKEIPDFNSVLSKDNMDYLEYHYPSVFQAMKDQPESYNKYKGAYETVKKLVPNLNSSQNAARAEHNLAKPKSLSTPGVSSQSDQKQQMWSMSNQERQANYESMLKRIKGIS